MLPPVERFDSDSGVRIYRISCFAFPDLIVHAYLLLEAGVPTLVDTGSGYGDSTAQLLAGLDTIHREFGEAVRTTDIRRIIITHGHIDHFGGLAAIIDKTDAEVLIHELDRRILTAYEERVVVATKALQNYVRQAGVSAAKQAAFVEMYSYSKRHVRSLHVDRTLRDGDMFDGLRFIHTPGHCPGQVCIGLGNVLLTADHVLPGITPHMAPESITPYTGLGHYLESLAKIGAETSYDLALGGHEGAFRDIPRRVGEIRASHERKLAKILDIIRNAAEPPTVNEISKKLYRRVSGFHVLLALEEVGAHIEYLDQHGQLAVANLEEIEREEHPAFRYRIA